jgi:hypothetical protein
MFSGYVASRWCKTCGVDFQQVTPTSILFFLGMIVLGTLLSLAPVKAIAGPGWRVIPLALIANVVLTVLLLSVIQLVSSVFQPLPKVCPRCKKNMEGGGSFYDFAMVPTLQEIAFFVIYLGIQIGAILRFRL